jgi:STAS domain
VPSYASMAAPRPRPIVCDVRSLPPDAASLGALARVQLEAQREGFQISFRHASRELHELLAFAGLAGVLRVETGGEPEQREERGGIEEERHLDDPAL